MALFWIYEKTLWIHAWHYHSLLIIVGTTYGGSQVEQHLQENIRPIVQRSGSSHANIGEAYVYLIFVDKLLAKYLKYVARLWNLTTRVPGKSKKEGKSKARDSEYEGENRKYAWSKCSM